MKRLLIANRGEIARRIIRSADSLGIATVAVYSDADASALHVKEAGTAFALGGLSAADSYLRIDRLIEAARATGADAVHPGYGFLSEDADFAQAVVDAGLLWVGPPAQAIRALGNKSALKQRAVELDIPILPSYAGDDQSLQRFEAEAERIGYPVMVKAAAGGGGRGMRLVTQPGELAAAWQSARSEAQSAFGSGELLLERALLAPRHVEVQVFADSHGHCIHLGERDCSVQRRHQKLIEESPSPAVDAALRERLGACAVRLALSAGYVGAGTVEFLLEHRQTGDERAPPFFLMEMNTRLQVEHPVTEALTGIDLVAWQLRVARGEALPMTQQSSVVCRGHAIEVRLCAEDEDFRPHAGTVRHVALPRGVRLDHALHAGAVVSPHYDSMLGKLIAYGANREQAIARLQAALADTVVLGLPTNRALLAECLADPVFRAGEALIPFLAERGDLLRAAIALKEAQWRALWVTALWCAQANAAPPRLAAPFARALRLRHRGEVIEARVAEAPGRLHITLDGVVTDVQVDAEPWRLTLNGVVHPLLMAAAGPAQWHVQLAGCDAFIADASFDAPAGAGGSAAQDIKAPFSGRIVALHAAAGQAVAAGETLLVIESMKLEHAIAAPRDTAIASVAVEHGQQVAAQQVLLRFA
ncbi:geranyl-CoA carboxylase alpha subunit [Burkholderiaceae bacterium]|nr:geranyl-CoA carboxylase alpha subunit [Burkholderiaceae bacterium]